MYLDPFSTTTTAVAGIDNPGCVRWRETLPSQEESAGRDIPMGQLVTMVLVSRESPLPPCQFWSGLDSPVQRRWEPGPDRCPHPRVDCGWIIVVRNPRKLVAFGADEPNLSEPTKGLKEEVCQMWGEGCVCGGEEDGWREGGGKWLVCTSVLCVCVLARPRSLCFLTFYVFIFCCNFLFFVLCFLLFFGLESTSAPITAGTHTDGGFDWCCFYYFLRNSLVALLQARFARCIKKEARKRLFRRHSHNRRLGRAQVCAQAQI